MLVLLTNDVHLPLGRDDSGCVCVCVWGVCVCVCVCGGGYVEL